MYVHMYMYMYSLLVINFEYEIHVSFNWVYVHVCIKRTLLKVYYIYYVHSEVSSIYLFTFWGSCNVYTYCQKVITNYAIYLIYMYIPTPLILITEQNTLYSLKRYLRMNWNQGNSRWLRNWGYLSGNKYTLRLNCLFMCREPIPASPRGESCFVHVEALCWGNSVMFRIAWTESRCDICWEPVCLGLEAFFIHCLACIMMAQSSCVL